MGRPWRTLVVNAKGGCGKTTVATNLASLYAGKGIGTALFDYDPQGSSMQWLALRAAAAPAIHGVAAARGPGMGMTRTFQMRMPAGIERVFLDAPAGVERPRLVELTRDVDAILVPVIPSPLDLHAATAFIEEVLRLPRVRSGDIQVGVLPNRVPHNARILEPLGHFLAEVAIPEVARLRDNFRYLEAAAAGMGLCELGGRCPRNEQKQWRRVMNWLDGVGADQSACAAS